MSNVIRKFLIVFSLMTVLFAQLNSAVMAIEMVPSTVTPVITDLNQHQQHHAADCCEDQMLDSSCGQSKSCENGAENCPVAHCISLMDITLYPSIDVRNKNQVEQTFSVIDPEDGFYISFYRPPISH